MVGAQSVVTPGARDVTREFSQLVEQRDVGGLGFIAVAGAVGVSLANDVVDMVLPRLGFNPDPQTSTDFLAAGLTQVGFAALVVTIGAAMSATSPLLFAIAVALSIGSVVIGGANLFEWGQRQVARFTNENPVNLNAGQGGSGNRNPGGSGRRGSSRSSGGILSRRG